MKKQFIYPNQVLIEERFNLEESIPVEEKDGTFYTNGNPVNIAYWLINFAALNGKEKMVLCGLNYRKNKLVFTLRTETAHHIVLRCLKGELDY